MDTVPTIRNGQNVCVSSVTHDSLLIEKKVMVHLLLSPKYVTFCLKSLKVFVSVLHLNDALLTVNLFCLHDTASF